MTFDAVEITSRSGAMSVYRRMKVTNLKTRQVYGYLGRAGLLRERNQKLYRAIESAPEYASDITWEMKGSDLDGKGGIAKPGVAPGGKRPSTAEEWARMDYAYLATRNIKWSTMSKTRRPTVRQICPVRD